MIDVRFPRLPASVLVALAAFPVNAAPVDRELRASEAFVTPISRTVNAASVAAAAAAREALQGQVTSIPSSWRLVSVLPKGSGYVMFFQDTDGSVRSLGLDTNGAVSGADALLLKGGR
jgi:hypothetical protein